MMSFRKRKKKANNSHFKVRHNNNNNSIDDIAETTNSITDIPISSMSLSFQHSENSARIKPIENNHTKKRKKRKMRIKAAQRSFQSNSNNNNNNNNNNTNIGIYNDQYLNSLKLENKAMPDYIKQSINDSNNNNNNNVTNESTNDIQMSDNSYAIDTIDPIDATDPSEDNETIKAKILTSKLQRRTKALSNTINNYAQNISNNINNTNTMHSIPNPMDEFIQLGKFKSTRDEIEERLNQNNHNDNDIEIDVSNDNDDFERQQMAKCGIKLKTKKKKKKRKNIIVIDDQNQNENQNNNFYNSSEWNICNNNDALNIDNVLQMIDNDMNGKQNIMKAPHITYENVEEKYHNIENNLRLNMKQCEAMEEKHDFFQTLQNESIAYLNCLSEKQNMIEKYTKMNIYLRENKCNLLRMNYCFNELECYHQTFYPNDFVKDITAANAYKKLCDLNENDKESNQGIFNLNLNNNNDLKIWNEQTQTLNKRNYLLRKKQRSEYRQENKEKLQLDCYSNQNIENNYFISREKLLKEIHSIFEDTRMKYRSFNLLNEILIQWKNKYAAEYEQAFVSISVPKLIAPFVRLELIEWNALKCKVNIDSESDNQSTILCKPKLFISHKWYELICKYGTNENNEMSENDSDDLIIPTLVATLVIKELINVIKYDWNIYNKQETKQLLLNINCAFEHIDSYAQFDGKKELLIQNLYDKCDEMTHDMIELKCIDNLIEKILPNFKRLPNKPLDCIHSNSDQIHNLESNVPNGDMYKYIKQRVWNALKLLHCVWMIIVGIHSLDSCIDGLMQYLHKITENIYKSVIEGFMTYLARCPVRNAKNKNHLQVIILDDLSTIVQMLFSIKEECKQQEYDSDDNEDVQMNGEKHIDLQLPQYIIKHIKRCCAEINDNINSGIKMNPNVTQNLNYLNKIC